MAQKPNTQPSRDRVIIRTSVIGILVNVLLAAFKALVGVLSNSVAVLMDAVNNLSDALSSVITIVGTRLASRPPDKKHPLGYGRVEYLSATIIAVIVLYAGVTAFVESVKKILHPETPDYSVLSLVIITVAVAAKLLLGRYVKGVGKRVNSDSLVASGQDALFDSVISASTVAAALIFLFFHVSLEAWLGAIIALVIIKSGLEMLRDTVSQILGERVDASFARDIRKTVCSVEGVQGAYDLILNNYGPDRHIASVHIEVPDVTTAAELDAITRKIEQRVFREHGVFIGGVSVYSVNTNDDAAAAMRSEIVGLALARPHVLQVHGFYADTEAKLISFDAVVDFEAKDRKATTDALRQAVLERYPGYQVNINLDWDISD